MKVVWIKMNCELLFLSSSSKCQCFSVLIHFPFSYSLYMDYFNAWLLPPLKLSVLSAQGPLNTFFPHSILFPCLSSHVHQVLLFRLRFYKLTSHVFIFPVPMPSMKSKCISICFDHAFCCSNKHMKFKIHQLTSLFTNLPKYLKNRTEKQIKAKQTKQNNCYSFSTHQFEQDLNVPIILDFSLSLTSLKYINQQNLCETAQPFCYNQPSPSFHPFFSGLL